MTAKIRSLSRSFTPEYQSILPNLLVSGASNTWNNSESDICTWPYYTRDLGNFAEVFDCSQSGAGCNHVFNSIVNEIESNPIHDPHRTLVICHWPDMSRTDVVNLTSTVKDWHNMSLYHFDARFASFTLFPDSKEKNILAELGVIYRKVVDMDAQILESALKIIGLYAYLNNKGFHSIFLTDAVCRRQINQLSKPISDSVRTYLANLFGLEDYATSINAWEYHHPTPDAHLQWTRLHLLPYLLSKHLIELK